MNIHSLFFLELITLPVVVVVLYFYYIRRSKMVKDWRHWYD